MKRMGSKMIAGLLAVALVLTMSGMNQIVAQAKVKTPVCTLQAVCHDWGEAI